MYTFQHISPQDFNRHTRGIKYTEKTIRSVPAGMEHSVRAALESDALFFGKLRAVLGDPFCIGCYAEEVYDYAIEADDGQGNRVYFSVWYYGDCPAVTVPTEDSDADHAAYRQARDALLTLIDAAMPIDYTWEFRYKDIPVRVIWKVQDGKAEGHAIHCDEDTQHYFG